VDRFRRIYGCTEWEMRGRAFRAARHEELLSKATFCERVLWPYLEPLGFERQYQIWDEDTKDLRYPDFFHAPTRIAVEVNGSSHNEREEEDAERTAELEAKGITVLDFSNDRVNDDLEAVVEEIKEELRSKGFDYGLDDGFDDPGDGPSNDDRRERVLLYLGT
jgi:very-short-patch-repair endonuclease